MELSQADKAAFADRSQRIDYDRLKTLHYLGNYVRRLPVKLSRMMENAYDWEHLPFVHASSFADISLVEQGPWGWRCKTDLPSNAGDQLLELLVDREQHYWATTVVRGSGEGIEIHTQATARDDGGIEVDVRFYSPVEPETAEQSALILAVLKTQYQQLYDEDEALMLGRQSAIDAKLARPSTGEISVDLGPVTDLDPGKTYEVDLSSASYVVRFFGDQWRAHSATCPHMLGPLNDAMIAQDGRITCPWHGYRFAIANGAEEHGRCGALPLAQCDIDGRGHLMLSQG